MTPAVGGGSRQDVTSVTCLHLQEPADVGFVVGGHENHVLKEPEERTVIIFLRLQHGQYAVKLKEETSGALCRTGEETQELRAHTAGECVSWQMFYKLVLRTLQSLTEIYFLYFILYIT